MTFCISRRYEFESAHFLPKVPEEHRCRRLHGHHYVMEVFVTGEVNDVGFTIDFWDLDRIISPLIERVDHRLLNEVPGLENPTAELIAEWFFMRIDDPIDNLNHKLDKVRIWETPSCFAEFSL